MLKEDLSTSNRPTIGPSFRVARTTREALVQLSTSISDDTRDLEAI